MSGPSDRAAIERLLAVPEMAWLVARVQRRLLEPRGEPLTGVVVLSDPSAAQREAAIRLVGRSKRSGAALRLDLGLVEKILRRGPWPAGLADAIETLTGPVVDRAVEREREAAAWARAGSGLVDVATAFPALTEWWDAWCASGGLKRAARAEAARVGTTPEPAIASRLVLLVADVMACLPASGEPLAVLARRVVGDAHGLDSSRPLGRLAAAVVAVAYGRAPSSDVPSSPRDTWAAAGVVMSNVASTVLCLGLPGHVANGAGESATATAAALEAMRAARMPTLLTLDQVRSGGVGPLPRDCCVHVCENPTVVEVVAARWATLQRSAGAPGAVGPVLVCTWGQASTAVVELLGILLEDGAECRYHGDFDWAGLRIARALGNRVPWVAWRFTAADYLAAVRTGTASLHLVGRPAEAPWDPELASVMAKHGVAVEEEAVADLLAADVLRA